MTFFAITTHDLRLLIDSRAIQILLSVLIGLIIQAVGHPIIERLVRRAVQADKYESVLDERKREDTVVSVLRRTFSAITWLFVVVAILTILRIHVEALLTGAGLVGVVVGLGAQNTIKDYLAGFYVLSENQYRVGDIVTLSGGTTTQLGASGVVEELSLRVTKLRDLDGQLHIFRNGDAGIISNRTFKYASVVIDVGIAFGSDIDQVENIVDGIGRAMLEDERWRAVIIEPMHFLRVDDITQNGLIVKCIGKVMPAAQWDVGGDFRRKLAAAFKAESISFALPQLELQTVKE